MFTLESSTPFIEATTRILNVRTMIPNMPDMTGMGPNVSPYTSPYGMQGWGDTASEMAESSSKVGAIVTVGIVLSGLALAWVAMRSAQR